MVGQTLTVRTKPYQYYRCRHVYDKNTSRTCTARYVDGSRLEEAVWAEMKRVLTNPDIVLQELKRVASEDTHDDQGEQLEQALADLALQEKRLVDLYTVGGITAAAVREKSDDLSKRRKVLEAQLASVQVTARPNFEDVDLEGLQRACAGVADWVDQADEEDRRLALEALQVSISATKGAATMSGVLPTDTPGFITDEQSSRCLYNGDQICACIIFDQGYRPLNLNLFRRRLDVKV